MLRDHRRSGAVLGAARGAITVLVGLVGTVAVAGSGPKAPMIVTGSTPAALTVAVAMVMEPHPAVSPAPPPVLTPRPAPPPPTPPPATPASRPAVDAASLASSTLALLNADRAAQGLAPLQISAALSRAAVVHAAQNAAQGRLFHDGLVAHVNAQDVGWRSLGEILGTERGTTDAAFVNGLWLASPEHRGIILTPQYTTVGVGWAQAGNGDWYVSAIFIS
ncbi:MAG TPA: CAP domain-containing protein [Candidatus Dormibacteraeota bacterium]|jgi:uncharacterized protein YkwD|nr:CAP domain-containing protein [Candidatus Dormibacteraeota bacterium]